MFTISILVLFFLAFLVFRIVSFRLAKSEGAERTKASESFHATAKSRSARSTDQQQYEPAPRDNSEFDSVWAARLSWGSLGMFCLVFFFTSLTLISAGTVGVVDTFGIVSDKPLSSGINFTTPWASVHEMSIKTEEIKEDMDVPSKEGLSVHVEISALMKLQADKAPEIYRTIGPNYREVIFTPNFRSVVRGTTSTYDAKALYTSEREVIERTINGHLENIVGPRGITMESTPLRKVVLPPGLAASIEQKLQMEQESQRMQFVLSKERQEADRKRIEAQGISDFQGIVSKGISEQLLKWKGIEATEKLAASHNAKVVIIGSGKDGLPLILDGK